MSTPDRDEKRAAAGPRKVSMSELLASCAAANAVSTPPRPPAPPVVREERRQAA
ncbi:hypothetical protein [Streptomyces cavernae]|uniref:hypothetical protein n=1 Tax=Streptomyces cavernae TaxID=2259034 RepID=UPI00192E3D6E|nr:hypothetical protein [Streptomyces cavernae]